MSFPWDLFMSALVTLLVVIDPPGAAPIFAGLTTHATDAARRSMAWRSVLIASGILLAFAVAGEPFLGALGISLDAFRIAGGIMLFLIAVDMVFEKRTKRREERAQAVEQVIVGGGRHRPDEQVFSNPRKIHARILSYRIPESASGIPVLN